eukprot:8292083-Ditylum_brightwellii.AAC.1
MNFYSYFLASECITTLDGKPADKKQHYPNGSRAPSKFVPHCKTVEEYYEGMLNAQFLIGIEEAIQTIDIFKRITCSVIGVCAANSFALANKLSPTYMGTNNRRKGGMSGFVHDICIGQD